MSEEFLYKVGDEFEGSAVEASRFLKLIHSVGGLVEIDGKIVRVIYLPPEVESKVEASVPVKPAVKEPVKEEPVPDELVVEKLVVEEPVIEMTEEFVPPKRRGRPPVTKESSV